MFKENIMKKIAGLSLAAIVMMPGVAKAAVVTEATVADNVCTAKDMQSLKDCMSKSVMEDSNGDEVNTKDVDTITLTADALNITENITVTDYALSGNLTVKSGKTLTLSGSSKITGNVTVDRGTLKITSKVAAITGSLDIDGGIVTITADGTNGNSASTESTVSAVTGAITVNNSTLTVNKGTIDSTLDISGKSTVVAQDIDGKVTIDGDGVESLTANKLNGGIEVSGESAVTVDAKEISGTVTVNNLKSTVQYVADNATSLTVTKGLVRKTNVVSASVSNVEVYVGELSSVTLNKDEILVVDDLSKLGEGFTVTAPNGAKIDNQTGVELTITVNGEKVTISKDAKADDAYVVANGSNVEQPGDTTQTPDGDVTVDKNPATGDSIMSYVTLALTSVASLGLAVKKFLF